MSEASEFETTFEISKDKTELDLAKAANFLIIWSFQIEAADRGIKTPSNPLYVVEPYCLASEIWPKFLVTQLDNDAALQEPYELRFAYLLEDDVFVLAPIDLIDEDGEPQAIYGFDDICMDDVEYLRGVAIKRSGRFN